MPNSSGPSGRLLAVTDDMLTKIVGFGAPVAPGTADEINGVVAYAKILTHLELAFFVAQCCYESAYFRQYVEPPVAGRYEGRQDLGNVNPGDGQLFRGRGAIQLTGRANYTAFESWLAQLASEGALDFSLESVVDSPDLVGTPPYRWMAAAWFWSKHPRLQTAADQDDVPAATAVITGAHTPGLAQGLEQRERLTNAAVQELG